MRTERLGIDFGGGVGLHDVDLRVPEGGVHALIGPNGAGKTTLFSLLTGLVRAHTGTIESGGRIAYCPDTPEHEPWLTATEVVAQSRTLSRAEGDREQDREVLDRCGLGSAAGRRVGAFSRGMTQRLGLAATIVTGAPVLVLDEPTSALDPFGQADVLALVRELGRDRTVLISSHSLAAVEQVADTVAILHEGRLRWQGTLVDLLGSQLRPTWQVRTTSSEAAAHLLGALRGAPGVTGAAPDGPVGVAVTYADVDAGLRDLSRALAEARVPVVSSVMQASDLDGAFVALLADDDRREAGAR
ncbi:hypothetical protein ADJ73_11940 [Arsenicicoccus sp. oral taxon 190]|nr:hypothetical protein ADJ73_11940 [Arsenicicoccus sp. oral taxon 190]